MLYINFVKVVRGGFKVDKGIAVYDVVWFIFEESREGLVGSRRMNFWIILVFELLVIGEISLKGFDERYVLRVVGFEAVVFSCFWKLSLKLSKFINLWLKYRIDRRLLV
jgi:hypothetical protein